MHTTDRYFLSLNNKDKLTMNYSIPIPNISPPVFTSLLVMLYNLCMIKNIK